MGRKYDTSQTCIICGELAPCGCTKIVQRTAYLNHAASPVEEIRLAALAQAQAKSERRTRVVPADKPKLEQPGPPAPRAPGIGGEWKAPRSALDAIRAASAPVRPVPADSAAPTMAAAATESPARTDHTSPINDHVSGDPSAARAFDPAAQDGIVGAAIEVLRPLLGKTGGVVMPDGTVQKLQGR